MQCCPHRILCTRKTQLIILHLSVQSKAHSSQYELWNSQLETLDKTLWFIPRRDWKRLKKTATQLNLSFCHCLKLCPGITMPSIITVRFYRARGRKTTKHHPNSCSFKFSICISSAVAGRYGLAMQFLCWSKYTIRELSPVSHWLLQPSSQSYQVVCEIIRAFSVANFLLQLTLMGALSIHQLNLHKAITGGALSNQFKCRNMIVSNKKVRK